MGKISDAKLKQYYADAKNLGYREAAKKNKISHETMRRRVREYKKRNETTPQKPLDDNIIRQLKERFTDVELRAIAAGGLHEKTAEKPVHTFEGAELNIGILADTHIGSVYTDVEKIQAAFATFENCGVDMVVHAGDVFEGMSNRPGHIYELTELGYHAQLQAGREIFSRYTDYPIYFVDGNHDRWFIKSSGAMIVEELCRGQDNLKYLGHDEGDIKIKGSDAVIRLWHGEDGNSYSISYRLEKLVEAFTGGEKPNILIAGHCHKAAYFFPRHVHTIGAGSIQRQSKWLRAKRIAVHCGFWMAKIIFDEKGVVNFAPVWYPFYE
jgi:predicted phosphodiesterase